MHGYRAILIKQPSDLYVKSQKKGTEGGGSSFLDAVDDALAAYSDNRAVHLNSLKITVPRICGENVPASRVTPWLRFASQRLVGAFYLCVYYQPKSPRVNHKDDELELPPCEGATKIELQLGLRFLLRIPPAGTFAVLADLEIHLATMEGRELNVLVSSQCPRSRNLKLVVKLLAASDVAVRSATLRSLMFHVRNTRRLDIAAPMLEILDASKVDHAQIAAPNLAEVVLSATKNVVFADTRRHLRRLAVTVRQWSAMAPLMRRFDSLRTLCLQTPRVWTISSFLSRFMSMNHLMHWLMLFYCWLICQ
jgi:hypothetical protein